MNRPRKPSGSNPILVIGTLIAVAIVVGVIYQSQSTPSEDLEMIAIPEQEVAPVIQAPVVPEAVIPSAPEPEAEPQVKPQQKLVSKPPQLPGIDNSDDFIRDRLLLINSKPEFSTWVKTDDLVRRTASYFDGLSNGVILSKILPLTPPEGKFATHKSDGSIWLNAGNYERYDRTINAIANTDMASIAKMFHFSRPLLETAFSEMGYNPRQMDGIVLQAIDMVLATPIIIEPIKLTRESVIYKFADPALEALPPIQKQLLRTGPENTKHLQQQATALRNALLNPN
jgi:hypothetical protein|tara:strand:+ start:2751 stop:3602 length:852 start_codon:yes stop_codon:yes gene_type:complete